MTGGKSSFVDFRSKRSSLHEIPSTGLKRRASILNSNLVPDKMNLIDVLKDFSRGNGKIDKVFTEKKRRRNNFSILGYAGSSNVDKGMLQKVRKGRKGEDR